MEDIERAQLVAVQTPQGFEFEIIAKAYVPGEWGATDDSFLASKIYPVTVVQGSVSNLKITRAEDLEMAEALLLLRQQAEMG